MAEARPQLAPFFLCPENQGVAKGGRLEELDHFFLFGHLLVIICSFSVKFW